MIDEKKLIEKMWDKYNSFYNDAHRFDIEDTGMANRVLSDIQKMIEEQPKVGEWIPCSERLPKEDKKAEYYDSVIVTLDNGRVAEGCYRNMEKEWWVDAPDGEHFSENMTGHVIAWQPLPEPYKE